MTIGDRIRARRISLGMTVDALADIIKKNRATVYRYENNYIEKLPLSVMNMLAKALKTSIAYLEGNISNPDIQQSEIDYLVRLEPEIKRRYKNGNWFYGFSNWLNQILCNDEFIRNNSETCDIEYLKSVAKGEHPITIDEAAVIAKSFGTSIEEILFNIDNIPVNTNQILKRAEMLRQENENKTSKWQDSFRKWLSNEIVNIDSEDARTCFIDLGYLRSVASGELPVTLNEACFIAEEFNVSLDEVLNLNITKNMNSFMKLFRKLSTEQQNLILAQIKGIISAQGEKSI